MPIHSAIAAIARTPTPVTPSAAGHVIHIDSCQAAATTSTTTPAMARMIADDRRDGQVLCAVEESVEHLGAPGAFRLVAADSEASM